MSHLQPHFPDAILIWPIAIFILLLFVTKLVGLMTCVDQPLTCPPPPLSPGLSQLIIQPPSPPNPTSDNKKEVQRHLSLTPGVSIVYASLVFLAHPLFILSLCLHVFVWSWCFIFPPAANRHLQRFHSSSSCSIYTQSWPDCSVWY